jgi:hypothetical protein
MWKIIFVQLSLFSSNSFLQSAWLTCVTTAGAGMRPLHHHHPRRLALPARSKNPASRDCAWAEEGAERMISSATAAAALRMRIYFRMRMGSGLVPCTDWLIRFEHRHRVNDLYNGYHCTESNKDQKIYMGQESDMNHSFASTNFCKLSYLLNYPYSGFSLCVCLPSAGPPFLPHFAQTVEVSFGPIELSLLHASAVSRAFAANGMQVCSLRPLFVFLLMFLFGNFVFSSCSQSDLKIVFSSIFCLS